MKQVYDKDFGKCPHCGSKMVYMISTYQLGVPGPGGTNLSQVIGEDRDITAKCPKCEFTSPMISSVYGITTREYAKLQKDKDKISADRKKNINLIGYIDENK